MMAVERAFQVMSRMAESVRERVAFAEAARVWARVAALSFGGPAGQIAVMHRILVEEKAWIGERQFLHALNFCMLLPGPEAHQLAIYLGWLLHGARGGLVAGLLFVLPGFLAIMALSLVYVAFGQTPLVAGLLYGVKAAVLAIVLQALIRIGSRALTGTAQRLIALVDGIALQALFDPDLWTADRQQRALEAGLQRSELGAALVNSPSHEVADRAADGEIRDS